MKAARLLRLTDRQYSQVWNLRTILPVLLSLGVMPAASVFAARLNPSPDSIDKDVRYVDCSSSNKLVNSINTALASLDPSEDDTIYVKGACAENVSITGFDRLKLIAQNGASTTDASGDTAPVVSIDDFLRVSVQGFAINGRGPNAQTELIDCTFSHCFFSGNTVPGGSDGVDVFRWARASFQGDVFQDNHNGAGIFVAQDAFAVAIGVTSQRNGQGANVAGGFLQINSRDGKRRDIWVYEWERDTLTRLTFAGESNGYPVWTPDGQRIAYSSQERGGANNLWWIRADGAGDAQRLAEGKYVQFARSWRPDGKILAFRQFTPTRVGTS